MALELIVVETTNNEKSRKTLSSVLSTLFDDQKYSVGGGGQVNFTVVKTFVAETRIDVFVNGILMDESEDYTRNTSLNRIQFLYTIPQNSKVMIRVY